MTTKYQRAGGRPGRVVCGQSAMVIDTATGELISLTDLTDPQ